MLKLKASIVKIKRSPIVFVVNTIGLSLAITILIILGLHINSELSVDKFQENRDRIVRIHHGNGSITPSAFGTFLTQQIPEVKSYLRLYTEEQQITYKPSSEQPKMFNLETIFADSTWSRFFHTEMVYGDKKTCLNGKRSVVITESTARRLFGKEDPMDKILYLSADLPLVVSGVIKDYPEESMFDFDLLINLNVLVEDWSSPKLLERYDAYNFETFLLLSTTENLHEIEQRCDTEIFNRLSNLFVSSDYYKDTKLEMAPFSDLYFMEVEYSRFKRGNKKSIQFYTIIAFFILLIAIINYINIATVRSFEYMKSINIKRIFGAKGFAIAFEIIIEGVLVVFISSVLAILLTSLVLPYYSNVINRSITIPNSLGFYMFITVIVPLVVGILVSFFPAIYLSRQKVHSDQHQQKRRVGKLRNLLSFLQFSGTIILMIAIAVIYLQNDYMLNYDTGINKENILKVSGNYKALKKADVFRQQLNDLTGVEEVSFSKENPINVGEFTTFRFSGQDEQIYSKIIYTDCHLVDVFDIQMQNGQGFDCNHANNKGKCIINQAAADLYVNGDVLNAKVFSWDVIGVVEDFNFSSLHNDVSPLILAPARYNAGNYYVKLNGTNVLETVEAIEAIYKGIFPEYIYQYQFVDEQYNNLYKGEIELQKLLPYLGLFAIIISCLGLFSLSIYTTMKRTKEIGILKVNGASVFEIILKLAKSTFVLIVVAFIIAVPFAYLIMNIWLENFAYKISLSWWVFIGAGIITVFLAMLSVSWQVFKAARRNPVEALRYE